MNEIVVIETRIKEGDAALAASEKHTAKAVELKISAGKLYADARQLCYNADVPWREKLKEFTTRSVGAIYNCMKIADASDPYAEEAAQRESNAAAVARSRSLRKEQPVPHVQNDVEEQPVQNAGVEEWTAPYPEPKVSVEIPERANVKETIAMLFDLALDERAFVISWIEKQGWFAGVWR